MNSLKSALPQLAPLLDTTPDALYSRQRKLAQIGLLEAAPGRGPGSGTPFTVDTLGILLISLLAADAPSEIDKRLVDLCKAKERSAAGQKLASPRTFRQAMNDSLLSLTGGKDGLVRRIGVTRYWRGEISVIKPGGVLEERVFLVPSKAPRPNSGAVISTTKHLELRGLLDIVRPFLKHEDEK